MSTDPLTAVTAAVDALVDARDRLVDACTSPDATDLAEFLATVREARTKLYTEVEQVLEDACARAMPGDYAETPTLRVERYRGTERKSWDHEAWQRDVRAKVLRQHGLLGVQGLLTADGEVVPPQVLHEVLRAVESVHSSAGPKTTELRKLGLDARDYCESSPGAYKVRVLRMTDESEVA
jgi:hypothetical protein